MGSAGCVLVYSCSGVEEHRGFEVQLFTNPAGSSDNDNDYPLRLVLSSFYFDTAQQPYGMPDGYSNCSLCQVDCDTCTGSMGVWPAHVPGAPGYSGNTYTRVHRDPAIINAMRGWMHLPPLNATLHAGEAVPVAPLADTHTDGNTDAAPAVADV